MEPSKARYLVAALCRQIAGLGFETALDFSLAEAMEWLKTAEELERDIAANSSV